MPGPQDARTKPPPSEADEKPQDATLRKRMAEIRQKLLVLSGKGGVGKSTVSVNLAIALARAGNTVGLLDVDVHGPSVPKLLGLAGEQLVYDGESLHPVRVSENLAVMSIGFLLPSESNAVIWRGPRKYGVIRQFLGDVAWGPLDYLVIDSPPGTGDEPLSVAQLVGGSAAAVLVTTPQDLAVSDVRRSVSFCRAVNLPVAGIIENMSGLVCPGCGERIDLFKTGGGRALAREVGETFLGAIPIDPDIVLSGDDGAPFALRDSRSDTDSARAFAAVVDKITGARGPAGPVTDESPPAHQAAAAENPAPDTTEGRTMKIAIPLADGRLSMHFGHCDEFALIEADPETKQVLSTQMLTPPAHEPGALPRWLHENGADVIIAGGMGSRAQGLFAQSGIRVAVGAPAEPAEDLVAAYLNGTLQTGQNICDH